MNLTKLNVNTIVCFFILLLIASSGMKWIPVLSLAGLKIEVHNFVSICSFFTLILVIFHRESFSISHEHFLLLAIMCLISFFSIIRGDDISPNLRVSMPAVLGSLILLQVRSTYFIRKYYYHCFFLLFLALFISASISDEALLSGLVNYFSTLNRDAFLYQTLRPIFNAFTPSVGVPQYGGPLVNHLSSGFYIFFAIACAKLLTNNRCLADWFVATLSFFMIFSLFSSTVLGATLVALFVFIVLYLKEIKNTKVLLTVTAIFSLGLPLLLGYLVRYITEGLLNDTKSITSRLSQNEYAIAAIEDHIFLGYGSVTFGGHGLHNLPLFAWTEGGILAFICVLIFYYFCLHSMLYALLHLSKLRGALKYDAFLMLVLPVFIITRTLFGGGGGLPATTEALALSLLIRAKRDLKKEIRSLKLKFY